MKKFPETYKAVIEAGHAIGNHTMHHINGWKTEDEKYIADINEAGKSIESNLFRPPYGRIKNSQLRKLQSTQPKLQTIMWSVLAGDWIATLAPHKCFQQVKNNVYPGCIIVFHDSEKANERMSYVLPKLLEHFSKEGFVFKKIEENKYQKIIDRAAQRFTWIVMLIALGTAIYWQINDHKNTRGLACA